MESSQVKSLDSLKKISLLISENYDLQTTLNGVIGIILDTLEVENASLMLLTSEGDSLRIAASKGLPEEVSTLLIPLGQGIAGSAAATGEPVLIENIESHAVYARKNRAEYSTKSALSVPMKLKSRLVGVVNVNNKRSGNIFTQEDLDLLSSIAPQIAAVIENAKLLDSWERKLRELGALFDLSKAAEDVNDLEFFLDECVQIITSASMVETCSVMLIDPMTGDLRIMSYTGTYLDPWRGRPVKLGEGVAGRVAQSGQPLMVNGNDQSGPDDRSSAMSVPMKIKGRVVGVVNLNNKIGGKPFDDDDMKVLMALAAQMGSSVEKLRLYNQMDQKIRELSTVNSVVTRINSSIDLKKVLDMIIDLLLETLDGNSGSLMMYDVSGDCLELEVSRGFSNQIEFLRFKLGEGAAGWVARQRTPVLIPNTLESEIYRPATDETPKSMICAPMVSKDKLLGVISVERTLGAKEGFEASDLELLVTLANAAATAIDNANLYKDLLNIYFETIQSLAAAIEAKDAYTHGHSRRVTDYSISIAREMGCDKNTLETIRHSALLHDIGKIGINEAILLKPGKLTAAEFSTIKSHPQLGAKILESIDFLSAVRAQLKHHHEKWDGTGYPDHLAGSAIPLGARIIAVADTFDAMTSTRSYRSSMDMETARTEISRCAETQFDPIVVEAFLRLDLETFETSIGDEALKTAAGAPEASNGGN